MNSADIPLWIAFGAGVLSFVSPCTLPLYPSYLSYITGMSVQELKGGKAILKKNAMLHTLFFIFGFSVIFFALGLSASWIGIWFSSNQSLISKIGGVLIIFLGLVVMGILQPKWMMKEKRMQWKTKPSGYFGTILVGISYAAGWTPCIGPILAAVLTLSASNPGKGVLYIIVYILGFAVPFFVMAFLIGKIKWLLKYANLMMKIGGGLMIFTGVLLFLGQMTKITTFLIKLYGGFTGF